MTASRRTANRIARDYIWHWHRWPRIKRHLRQAAAIVVVLVGLALVALLVAAAASWGVKVQGDVMPAFHLVYTDDDHTLFIDGAGGLHYAERDDDKWTTFDVPPCIDNYGVVQWESTGRPHVIGGGRCGTEWGVEVTP